MNTDAFVLRHPLRVRWSEIDSQGIVFNAHYLTYFDIAATEYWRALDLAYPDTFHGHGVDTFVVKATLEYHDAARHDDLLELRARVTRLGRTSLRLAIEVHRSETRLVSGELVYVIGARETRTPTPIPDWLRSAIASFERVAPEGA